jgi:hypothetical protein
MMALISSIEFDAPASDPWHNEKKKQTTNLNLINLVHGDRSANMQAGDLSSSHVHAVKADADLAIAGN